MQQCQVRANFTFSNTLISIFPSKSRCHYCLTPGWLRQNSNLGPINFEILILSNLSKSRRLLETFQNIDSIIHIYPQTYFFFVKSDWKIMDKKETFNKEIFEQLQLSIYRKSTLYCTPTSPHASHVYRILPHHCHHGIIVHKTKPFFLLHARVIHIYWIQLIISVVICLVHVDTDNDTWKNTHSFGRSNFFTLERHL